MSRSVKVLFYAILFLLLIGAPIYSFAQTAIYRAAIRIQDQELPFGIELKTLGGKEVIIIHNAEEQIVIDELKSVGDSLFARLPIFDSEIHVKQIGKDSLSGYWYNYSKGKTHTFAAKAVSALDFSRFKGNGNVAKDLSGRWEADFSPNSNDSSKAIGVFTQTGNHIQGTFLTPTGDYRFLEGSIYNDTLSLSCFDGSHAFLFKAIYQSDGLLKGTFWSGASWNEPWVAKRNNNYELPDPEKLTYLKPGYEKISFTFPDLNKQPVSLADSRFRNKVVIVQIMGSWCPNCMDESAFFADFYKKNKDKGIEIIGLAYERTKDIDKAITNVNRLKQRYGIEYPLLIAGFSDKVEAAKTLPMLNHIMSFPTTLIIDREGKVRKIHTGYSGPATGKYYQRFVEEFTLFIDTLIK